MNKIRSFAILCILVSVFFTTTTYALKTEKVRGKTPYSYYVNGSAGYYHGYSNEDGNYVYTYARNETTAIHYYEAATSRLYYEDMSVTSKSASGSKGTGGYIKTKAISRKPSSYVYDFYHRAYGYASSSSPSGKLDSFE